jgi:hypothetical protein
MQNHPDDWSYEHEDKSSTNTLDGVQDSVWACSRDQKQDHQHAHHG